MQIDGLPVENAVKPLSISITNGDIKRSKRKSPENCPTATACSRQLKVSDVRIHLARSYLRYNGKWVRYVTPNALRNEAMAYDRGGKFAPGDYMLYAVEPSKRDRRGEPNGKKRKKRSYRKVVGSNHILTDVRRNGNVRSERPKR